MYFRGIAQRARSCIFGASHDEVFMLIALLTLLLIVISFILKELLAVRRQISSIRQFLEWTTVGFLETRKDNLRPAIREYMENTKKDLIREGVSEGTISEQQANDLLRR
jgi:hypothetical protein